MFSKPISRRLKFSQRHFLKFFHPPPKKKKHPPQKKNVVFRHEALQG